MHKIYVGARVINEEMVGLIGDDWCRGEIDEDQVRMVWCNCGARFDTQLHEHALANECRGRSSAESICAGRCANVHRARLLTCWSGFRASTTESLRKYKDKIDL